MTLSGRGRGRFTEKLRSACAVTIILVGASVLLPCHAESQSLPARDMNRVRVTLEFLNQATGVPIENVVVRIPSLDLHLISDERGRVLLEDIEPGSYLMILSRRGFKRQEGDFSVRGPGLFQIPLSPTEANQDEIFGKIVGRVLTGQSSIPVEAARVTIVDTPLRRETDRNGLFEFREVPAGLCTIRVERLGMGTREETVDVPSDGLLEVEVRLSLDPIPLPGIIVTAHSKWLASSGYFRRMGKGYEGNQWDSGLLEELDPEILQDVLQTVSGINNAGSRGYVSRGRCDMTVFVDGFIMDRTFDLDMIRPESVEALEVYNGRGSTMPVEYARYCGVILVWLKH